MNEEYKVITEMSILLAFPKSMDVCILKSREFRIACPVKIGRKTYESIFPDNFMIFLLSAFLILIPCISHAEPVFTIGRVARPPILDGVIDDAAWEGIEPITEFVQYDPEEGAPPSERTELYLAYDQENIYLAFRCYDSNIGELRATMTQREGWDNDDCIGFAFDPYNRMREAFLFNMNPYGIPCDFIWHHVGYVDNGWDADLRTGSRIFDDSYCIEVAVPFKSLRMPRVHDQEWRFYALRCIKRRGEMVTWPARTRENPNLLSHAAIMRGISGIDTGRNFTILPYAFSSHTRGESGDERPFDLGTDIRYGITSDLMLDVTLNPDYSQIEADPDRIELSERYARMLPEKRPFFTEGTDIFVSNQALFYSRAITNPAAGLKLTGRMGRTRLGFLSAVDENVDTGNTCYFNHIRAKMDLLKESTLGVLMTNRDDIEEDACNRILSMDGVLRFGNIYSLKSQVSGMLMRDDDRRGEAVGFNANLERFGASAYNSFWYSEFPEDFDAPDGSMWEVVGFREAGTHNHYAFRKPSESINQILLYGGLKGRFDFEDHLQEEYLWAGVEGSRDRMWMKLGCFRNHEFCDGQDFRYSGVEYELWHTPLGSIEYFLSLVMGGAAHYSEGVTGWRARASCSALVKPLKRVLWNVNVSREDFYEEYGGSRSYLQTIVWNKLSFQILQSMFLRGILRHNSLDGKSNASLLFAYEYSPLSNIYVGANFKDFRTIDKMGKDMEAFLKIGYFWRL